MKVSMKKTTSKPSIIPLHDRVLVKTPRTSVQEKGERVIDGIIVPDSVSEQTRRATEARHIICEVLAVGADCTSVKIGQRVVVRTPDLFVMSPDIIGVEQTLIFEKHIMAVVK